MTSVDAIINQVIDGEGHVEDCDVVRACIEFNTTERVGSEWMQSFIKALPSSQAEMAFIMVDEYQCPSCQQWKHSAIAFNADGTCHHRCPHCGREW